MKTKTQLSNRILSLVLSIMMVVSMLPMNIMTASAAETTESAIDLSTLTGTYVISDSGEYTFTGTGSYGIKVESGNPRIILNDASITVGEGSAIDVASGSNATIFVLGDNTIGTTKTGYPGVPCGGIFVAEGGIVNITSNGTDNILRAHGTLAAAIGGKYVYNNNESYNAGSISISNVTVYAYTNNFYAAAIGAAGEGTCGTINITNAVVYAYGAGDQWTSAPGIGSAWSLVGGSDTIPVVIISDSEVHTFRHNSGSDYIGYLGDVEKPTNATGSINCGEGGSVTNSTIYCYTGLDATTTDKTVKYGALGGLLKEDGTCEGEHSGGTATCKEQAICGNCGANYGELLDHNWENGVCTYGCGEKTYNLYVGGKQVTSANAADVFGDGKVSFVPAEGDTPATLTLNNYTYSGEGYTWLGTVGGNETTYAAAICYEGFGTLNLVLNGESRVTQTDIEYGYGVYVAYGSIEISGTGSLHCEGNRTGVYAQGSITVKSGSLSGTAKGENLSYGVYAGSSITVEDGSLSGTTTGANSYGVFSSGSITVSGGSLSGTGSEAQNSSIGINAYSSITVSNGSLSGIGGVGVYAYEGDITVNSGSLSGTGSYLYGVYAFSKSVIVKGGSLSGEGTNEYVGYGIVAGERIAISGGVTVAQGNVQAFGYKPTIDSTFANAVVWYGDSDSAAETAGAKPIADLEINYYQKYVKIAPAPDCDHTGSTHTSATDQGNGKHSFLCTVCSITVSEEHTPDNEIGQTCQGYWCTECKRWYGEKDSDNHSFGADGVCINGCGEKTYRLWVGGEQFTPDKLTINDNNGGTATYDPNTHTLSLNNYNYTGEGYTSGDETYVTLNGIFVEHLKYDDATGSYTPLTLVITGQNSITVTPTGDETVSAIYGIQSFYPICVIGGSDGEDSLTVTTSGDAESESYAVWIIADLPVKNCNFVAINDVAAPTSIGVFADNITVSDGGKLAAICDTTDNGGRGIYLAEGSITVDGGEIVSQGPGAFTGNLPSIDETPAAVIWYGENETAAKAAGAKPSSELANNYRQKYVKIAPAFSCDHIGSTHTSATDQGNGKHSFICSVCGVTVSKAHTLNYSASGKVITESCSANCGYGGTATISATGKTYDGNAVTAAVEYSEGWPGSKNLTITYAIKNGAVLTEAPKNAGTYTASITDGGVTARIDFTIEKATPKAEDFVFSAPTDLIYDGTAKPATVTVKDGIVGMGEVKVMYFRYAVTWIDNQGEPIYPGRYKVGIWIEDGDNYNAVYSGERILLGGEFEIKYLTTDAKADISGTVGSNGWYTSDVTLNAPEGYQISNTRYSDGFTSELTFSAEQNETITYYLKDANGDVAEKTATLKIDKTAPSAKYKIGTDGWKQFINTITFGLFCKDYKTVDIEYTDDLSGVAKKQYYIANAELSEDELKNVQWNNYTKTLNLNATGKYFIYMRVVDNAGHEVILNTEGIVIYEDSVQVTESVSATYNAGTDKDVTVKLNGNTVNAIKNGNAVLTAGTDYTVSADGTITLKADYLDTLNAGEYTFTVSYYPQGVETDKVNLTTTFTVKVEKADGKVSNLNISGKTYDGTAITAPTFDKLGGGTATIDYKVKGADDSTYTTTAPSAAGDYVVRVSVAESKNYKAASATAEFTIGRASITEISVQQNGKLTYDGGKALTPAVTANATALNGAKVLFIYSADGSTYGSMPSFTEAGTYTVYYCAYTVDNNFFDHHDTFTVKIDKATVTEPTIASKPYNNSTQKADISDTDLYTVVKNDGGTAKGEYDVVLKLTDSANYKWSTTDSEEVTLKFVISAAENSWMTDPSISGWTYGQNANKPVYAAKCGTVKVVYTGKANDGSDYNSETAPTKAGDYTATFTVEGTEDYSGLSEQVSFTVAKKAVTVTANDASKTYGDSDPALTYTHTELIGSDALDITVSRASGENASTYTITASQAEGANPNYEITFKTGTFTIRKAALTVTAEDKTATYGDAVPTYTVKYEGFKNGDDQDDLSGALVFDCGYAQFSDKGEYTIKASGYTSGNYTISYVDGKLTVNAKPITVTIQNATSVYGDTLAELKATGNGIVNGDANVYSLATTATGTSNVGKYAITGTALDGNYDVTFVNGEYEITKREITITVDAKNTVVNTALPTYTYKVEGLVDTDTLETEPTLTCNANIAVIGEYDITASGADAGGNYSIKYVPAKLTVLTDNAVDAAAAYTEELKDYDPATVTSEDKEALDEILDEIDTILDDENITDNGKKALEEVKEKVEKLIEEITDAADATDTENVGKVVNVTPENVTPENKTDLEGAKADLEKALEDHGSNMTEDEKKAVEDEIKRIDEALEVISNVEAVEELIDKLPVTVKKDDEAAIKAADDAYNALTDYEKSLVDEDAKKALEDAKATLAELNKPADPNSPATGDNSNMFLWIALLFISGGAVITLTVIDRKRKSTVKR